MLSLAPFLPVRIVWHARLSWGAGYGPPCSCVVGTHEDEERRKEGKNQWPWTWSGPISRGRADCMLVLVLDRSGFTWAGNLERFGSLTSWQLAVDSDNDSDTATATVTVTWTWTWTWTFSRGSRCMTAVTCTSPYSKVDGPGQGQHHHTSHVSRLTSHVSHPMSPNPQNLISNIQGSDQESNRKRGEAIRREEKEKENAR